MNRYVADSTENDQVFIFVVSIVAYSALRVFLNHKTPLMRGELAVSYVLCEVGLFFFRLLQLLQYKSVVYVVFLLLPHL
jgi:hypothetical protein